MDQGRRASASILDQRLAMNACSAAEQHTTAMAAVRQVAQQNTASYVARPIQQPVAPDSATEATLAAIALMQQRFDATDLRATSTMASMNDSLRLLESRVQDSDSRPAAAVQAPAAAASGSVGQQEDVGNNVSVPRPGSTLANLRHNAPEQMDRYYIEQPRLESHPPASTEFG